MKIVGIDPGVEPTFCTIYQMKETPRLQEISFSEGFSGQIQMAGKLRMQPIPAILTDWLRRAAPDLVVIEDVWVMPKQGLVSAARFMAATYLMHGICHGLGISVVKVRPQAWKKYFNFKKGKDESRVRALERYPQLVDVLKRKKDHNRADALFIALYGFEKIEALNNQLEANHS